MTRLCARERVRVRVRVRRDLEVGVVTGLADPSRSRDVEREMVGWGMETLQV